MVLCGQDVVNEGDITSIIVLFIKPHLNIGSRSNHVGGSRGQIGAASKNIVSEASFPQLRSERRLERLLTMIGSFGLKTVSSSVPSRRYDSRASCIASKAS